MTLRSILFPTLISLSLPICVLAGDEPAAEEAMVEKAMPPLPVDPLLATAPPLAVSGPDAGMRAVVEGINSVTLPENETHFLKISEQLQTVLAEARAALVCIRAGEASGSGVIVSKSGLILTAAHVIGQPGQELTIVLADGTELKGEALGVDAGTDSGMARIVDEGEYPVVPLGDYEKLNPGDWVFALGHSGGWDKERGSVVRLGRIILKEETTVQSDCILIGGDSGGPLFDLYGRLIGINSRVGMNIEFSLHVPVSEFVIYDKGMRSGVTRREDAKPGFFGAGVSEVESDGDKPAGLEITKLAEGGASARAGLKVGDILTHADGVVTLTKAQLKAALGRRVAGERMTVTYYRPAGEGTEGGTKTEWVRLGGR